MDNTEAFSFVFFDSFMTALVLPIQMDVAFPAMVIFGGYPVHIAIACAFLGASCAVFLNMWIGRIIRLASRHDTDKGPDSKLTKVVLFIQKTYWLGLLLLAWIPTFGGLFTVMAGFSRVSVVKVLLFAAIANLGYYTIYASNLSG